ncbi:hypothetical protein PFICI_12433 [Pestalotiopsis fici W106-1]|uniref:Glutamine amidotransferase type-2 domain-containing protein n=1 Tax=Pestalotiopsis fici (strain W106-1 / CGMCC3.15140) TaxID=1229662 RepID=W3WNW8_PESFW|nr:uncharacterized protein PFICI_12433 [Pestalotiopsis fici W106-1]ETS75489.1 hypothetical protein PFICI_12433 [Pestalotiopsis fici W106-1]
MLEDNHKQNHGLATTYEREQLSKKLDGAIDRIRHRGPDGSGTWVSADGTVGLGHCRLSINDLSECASQPLHSDDGLVHAVINGEIYDFERLRHECEEKHGYVFKSSSDSEVLVALYKAYGAPEFFSHLRGEFAFVLFDEREGTRRVLAGRDRFGIKPLLWTKLDNRVLFASEAKAFLAMGWKPRWDVRSLSSSGWMIDDRTLFKDVRKLRPGHWIEVSQERGFTINQYWDAEYPDKTQVESRSVEEMILGVRERLVESIRLRLRADVPVGVYLSGGIDSSAVAGIVTELIRKEDVKLGSERATRVSCFSVKFPQESGHDESDIAERTADWLGVKSYKRHVDEARIALDFQDAAYHAEHHHFDLNTVAKFALSTLPREHNIKVILSGEGSDEHFAGYSFFPAEFLRFPDLNMPSTALAQDDVLRESLQKSASEEMDAVWRSFGATKHNKTQGLDIQDDLMGSTMPQNLLTSEPADEVFSDWVRIQYHGKWDRRETVLSSHAPEVLEKMRNKWHPLHTALYMFNKATFSNLQLAGLGDRSEMAHSIEARTPFLDHHLTEYVNSLPPSTKLHYQPPADSVVDSVDNFWWKAAGSALRTITEKWILREAVRPYITEELYNRRKLPFFAPVRWAEGGPLHDMFTNLLTREAVEKLGFVNYDKVEAALQNAFGDQASSSSFRVLCYTGTWVTLSQRFGMEKATVEEYSWA